VKEVSLYNQNQPKGLKMIKKLLLILLVIMAYGAYQGATDKRYSTTKAATKTEEVKTKKTDNFEDARQEVKKLYVSDKEPTAKDAVWATDKIFKVGVIDDNSKRDGYAQSVCYTLYEYGFKGEKVYVSIIDIRKLVRDKDWVEIGKARCE
jgi:hypothetical protein